MIYIRLYSTYSLTKPSVELDAQVLSLITNRLVGVFKPRQEHSEYLLDGKYTHTKGSIILPYH
jgi:hypothetical protein